VFCGTQNQPLHRKTFYRNWNKAIETVKLPGFHFHDLRHTGNTLAAATGASTKELMSRMGHASPRAALIYQHATQDRDAVIADALSKLIVKKTNKATLPLAMKPGHPRVTQLPYSPTPGPMSKDSGPTGGGESKEILIVESLDI
jgi:hypothetical protein